MSTQCLKTIVKKVEYLIVILGNGKLEYVTLY